jgi:lysophospholipase L1-like esterase
MNRISTIFSGLLMMFLSSSAQTSFKFDFGNNKPQAGFTPITTSTFYNAKIGYGFDLNSSIQSKSYKLKKTANDDYITSDRPFFFSVKLPDGNYTVKVTLGDKNGVSTTTIKAECRRLMIEKASTEKGGFITKEFTVHVRDSILRPANERVKIKPRESNYLHWDDKLTLEFSNSAAKVCALEIIPNGEATTIFLAGNSTVVDQAEEPWAAWGQMIPAFFQPNKVAVANYAESGETLKAFEREKRLEKIWSLAKSGDYIFIEFTHNDQKPGANYLEPFTTYKETLKNWISEARKRQMIPVLVTSMHRRNFDSAGQIINTLRNYPEAMKQTAKEENVSLIDLNGMSKILYEAWGPEKSLKAFVHYPANTFPNQKNELKDNTHFSSYGAYQLAKCVALGIQQSVPALSKYLMENLSEFNPAKPDDFKDWKLPVSPLRIVTKPDGN